MRLSVRIRVIVRLWIIVLGLGSVLEFGLSLVLELRFRPGRVWLSG